MSSLRIGGRALEDPFRLRPKPPWHTCVSVISTRMADPGKAVDAARTAYQGNGYNAVGELGYSPYLQRIYPDFDTIWQADDNRFSTLAEALYAAPGPILCAGAISMAHPLDVLTFPTAW